MIGALEGSGVAHLGAAQRVAAVAAGELVWIGRRDLIGVANFIRGDLDALLQPFDDDTWIMLVLERAQVLRLAARAAEAQALIKQTEDRLRARLEGPSNRDVEAVAAAWFAQTGDLEKARAHLGRALLAPPDDDIQNRFATDWAISMAERLLGDPQAAWMQIEPYASESSLLGRGELLALKKYYDQIYGESPGYRAYMAKIAGMQP